MPKRYGPRPLIEEHHHINELIEGQQKRVDDRERHRSRAKELEERDSDIAEASAFALTDFYCNECREDFRATAVKQVEQDWHADQRIAFYRTKCFNHHWCVRLITDKHADGFYQRSRLVGLDRGNHFADTVQPFESGFNMIYGKR